MTNMLQKSLFSILMVALLATGALAAPPTQEGDIVAVASADEQFSTLVTALQTAELVSTLQGEGPFTVFAPTDQAFENLPDGALSDLLANPTALQDVLLYHVVPGEVMAAEVINLESADTVLGRPVTISVDGETVRINDATVLQTDIAATNGVIHVIDTVLIPPEGELTTTPAEPTAAPAEAPAEQAAPATEPTAAPAEAPAEQAAPTAAPAEAPAQMPTSGGETPTQWYSLIALLGSSLLLISGGLLLRRYHAK